jgi:hypothetical protein
MGLPTKASSGHLRNQSFAHLLGRTAFAVPESLLVRDRRCDRRYQGEALQT